MQSITNNHIINTYTNSNTYKTQTTSNNSFEKELINTSSKHTENKDDGKLLRYLEQHKSFENIHPDDLKTFKEIIKDDMITEKEYLSIPYEKLNSFNEFIKLPVETKWDKVPIFFDERAMHYHTAYNYSADKDLNKALLNTYKELEEYEIRNLNVELGFTLEQYKNNIPIKISYMGNQPFINKEELGNNKTFNINFSEVLSTILTQTSDFLVNKNLDNQTKKQLLETKDLFSKLMNNYIQTKNESKYV